MSRVQWDQDGERFYETGVKNVVLYLKKNVTSGANPKPYNDGVAWNGVTSISENPSGAETTKLYADDVVYLSLTSNEELAATIEAYMSPEEFDTCDGSAELADGVSIGQQKRDVFGICYRTTLGNDEDGNDKGYKLHLVYGCKAAPSSKAYATINDSPEAITMSWEVSTTPVSVTGKKPTAIVTIDSTKATAAKLTALENILYGIDAAAFDTTKTYQVGDYVTYSSGSPSVTKTYRCKTAISTAGQWDATKWDEVEAGPRLPLPDEIATIFAQG